MLEVLADNKEVKGHIVKNIELFHLFSRRWMENGKSEFYFPTCSRRSGYSRDFDIILSCLGWSSFDQFHRAFRALPCRIHHDLRVHRANIELLATLGKDQLHIALRAFTLQFRLHIRMQWADIDLRHFQCWLLR